MRRFLARAPKSVAVWLGFVLLLATAVSAVRAGPVDGESVRMVDYGQGAFVQIGPNRWAEVKKATGKVIFSFVETARNASEVQMFDASRRMQIDLLLSKRQVLFARNGGAFRPLYGIVDVSAESRIPGSNVAWDAVTGNEASPSDPGPATGAVCVTSADCHGKVCMGGRCS
jgi:hypothetical protein